MPIRCTHLAVLIAGLVLLPVSAAPVAGASMGSAIALRARFVAGQSYAYHLTTSMQVSLAGDAALPPAQAGFVTTTGVMHLHIVRADRSGGAWAGESITNLRQTTTLTGHTTTRALPDEPAQDIYLSANGGQRGAATAGGGALGLQAVGLLPPSAVASGAHWYTSSLLDPSALTGLSLAPLHIDALNTFSGYVSADKQRAAIIDTYAGIEYMSDSPQHGMALHVHLSGRMRLHSLFGLAVQRLITQHAYLDMHMFMSQKSGSSRPVTMDGHVILDVTVRPQSW